MLRRAGASLEPAFGRYAHLSQRQLLGHDRGPRRANAARLIVVMHRICVVVCALAWQSPAGAQSASFGGEFRETWERFHNDFGSSPADADGYLLQRFLLHADLHLGDHVRTFVELQSGLEYGRVGGPRPSIDED